MMINCVSIHEHNTACSVSGDISCFFSYRNIYRRNKRPQCQFFPILCSLSAVVCCSVSVEIRFERFEQVLGWEHVTLYTMLDQDGASSCVPSLFLVQCHYNVSGDVISWWELKLAAMIFPCGLQCLPFGQNSLLCSSFLPLRFGWVNIVGAAWKGIGTLQPKCLADGHTASETPSPNIRIECLFLTISILWGFEVFRNTTSWLSENWAVERKSYQHQNIPKYYKS